MLYKGMKRKSGKELFTDLLADSSIWLFFAAIVILTTIFAPSFVSSANVISMLREAVVVGVLAIGMTFVIISGCFDLSAGAIMGICCVMAMRLGPSDAKSTFIAMAAPILLGIGIGLIDGFLVGILDLNGFIATLGMQYAVLGATLIYTKGSYTMLTTFTSSFDNLYCKIGTVVIGSVPLQVYIMAGFAVTAQFVLSRTNLGQNIKVSGANAQAAALSGVNVQKTRCICYAILGGCSACAGLILGSWVRQFEPQTGIGYEFEAITAVVLGGTSLAGGKGNVFNSVAGALIMVMIVNAMILLDISYNYQLMVRGLVLIAAVTIQVYTGRKNG